MQQFEFENSAQHSYTAGRHVVSPRMFAGSRPHLTDGMRWAIVKNRRPGERFGNGRCQATPDARETRSSSKNLAAGYGVSIRRIHPPRLGLTSVPDPLNAMPNTSLTTCSQTNTQDTATAKRMTIVVRYLFVTDVVA